MQRYRILCAAAVAAAVLIIGGCGDHSGPTGPASDAGQSALTPRFASGSGSEGSPDGSSSGPGSGETAVRWSGSHENEQFSVSGTIGILGGTLSIPKADFKITIPPLALTKSTAIKIIALKGNYVQYDMQPHGLTFLLPVEVKQGLRNTRAWDDQQLAAIIFGIYVAGDTGPAPNGSVDATEILPSQTVWLLVNGVLKPEYQLWQLTHFSRYMLASG